MQRQQRGFDKAEEGRAGQWSHAKHAVQEAQMQKGCLHLVTTCSNDLKQCQAETGRATEPPSQKQKKKMEKQKQAGTGIPEPCKAWSLGRRRPMTVSRGCNEVLVGGVQRHAYHFSCVISQDSLQANPNANANFPAFSTAVF